MLFGTEFIVIASSWNDVRVMVSVKRVITLVRSGMKCLVMLISVNH